MMTVTSKDGTIIAYDKIGQGPALVLVLGALNTSASGQKLAQLLSSSFTVYSFDRRGRGESSNTLPYSIEKEVADIETIIDVAGGQAFIYGHSSGAVLALYAAEKLKNKVREVALYEIPFNDSPDAVYDTQTYKSNLTKLLNEHNYGDAVALFLELVNIPQDHIAGMRQAPFWKGLEALAPTLLYDTVEIVGDHLTDALVIAKKISVPTLVMYGTVSPVFMKNTAGKFREVIPNSVLKPVEGEAHDVKPETISQILKDFFAKE